MIVTVIETGTSLLAETVFECPKHRRLAALVIEEKRKEEEKKIILIPLLNAIQTKVGE